MKLIQSFIKGVALGTLLPATAVLATPCEQVTNNIGNCECRFGYTLGNDGTSCVEVSSIVSASVGSMNLVRSDNTIRPASLGSHCFVHKMPGFRPSEKVYVRQCQDRPHFRWHYNPQTKQIYSDDEADSNRHCWTIQKKSQFFEKKI